MSQELINKAIKAHHSKIAAALKTRSETLATEIAEATKEDPIKVQEKSAVGAALTAMSKQLPEFHVGDTVDVSVRIVEGDKERLQVFTGVVIARSGGGVAENFTVRRIVNNEGVERVFPLQSPKVAGLTVIRSGKVRRAKLYFLRDRVGKATRLREIKRGKAAAPAAKAAEAKQQ